MQPDLRSYADYIRRNAMSGRQVERVGPFIATFTERTDNLFLNYAIPVDGAVPTDEDVAELIRAFGGRGRVPRLEYFPTLAPAVAERLAAAGFMTQGRLPLMVCTRPDLRPVPVPAGIAVRLPASEDEFLGAARAQHEAYEELEPAGPEDGARLRGLVERGGLVALAMETSSGAAAGAGVCDVIRDGLAELAGVGVRPRFRGRGVAAAMTHWLTRGALSAGAETVFLTPGGEAERRIYERVGFTEIAEQVHAVHHGRGDRA